MHHTDGAALTVLFDPSCALCQRSRAWMLRQPSYVTLTFVACSGEEARARRWPIGSFAPSPAVGAGQRTS